MNSPSTPNEKATDRSFSMSPFFRRKSTPVRRSLFDEYEATVQDPDPSLESLTSSDYSYDSPCLSRISVEIVLQERKDKPPSPLKKKTLMDRVARDIRVSIQNSAETIGVSIQNSAKAISKAHKEGMKDAAVKGAEMLGEKIEKVGNKFVDKLEAVTRLALAVFAISFLSSHLLSTDGRDIHFAIAIAMYAFAFYYFR